MNIKELLTLSHEAIRDKGKDARVVVAMPYKMSGSSLPYGVNGPVCHIIKSSEQMTVLEFKAQEVLDFVAGDKTVAAI